MSDPAPTPPRPTAHRLHWLDALRGLAVLTVLYWHLGPLALPAFPPAWRAWVDIGKCGVVLFFLISGYVIAMSLERGGMVRFWLGRIFRIYPAWLVSTAAMLLVFASGVVTFPASLAAAPEATVLAHATMLQQLLGVSNVVPVYWTLSYEMLFYLVVGGLFALGWHRHAGWLAAGLAAVALAGPALPQRLLTAADGSRRAEVAAILLALLAGTVAAYATGRRGPALACAAVGLGLAALPVVNGGTSPARGSWQSVILLAVMVAGAVAYQTQHGRIARAAGVAALLAVLGAAVAGGLLYLPAGAPRRVWLAAVLGGVALFGVGWLLRRARVPGVLVWLGQVSYSIYLLHMVLLAPVRATVPDLAGRQLSLRMALLVGYLVAVLVAAELVYRLVERPGQAVGRRLAARLEARVAGPVTADTAVTVPAQAAPAHAAPAGAGAPGQPAAGASAPGPPAPVEPVDAGSATGRPTGAGVVP